MHARRTATYCLVACIATPLAHADESTFAVDIPAQSLNRALDAFARQTGLQVVYETDLAVGRTSPAVKGKLTASEALDRLLRGTGLDSRILSERAVAISAPAARGTPITMMAPTATLLRVAEVNVDTQDTPAGVAQMPAPMAKTEALEEITVTGSHIRGAKNVGSPVMVLTREEMDRTGYATVQDILKTVTANAGTVPSDAPSASRDQTTNYGRGTAVGLRGLGASSTLLLVNGRRQPSAGLEGRFTDITSIPATAIERVEILTDGASALYGSDALGGVVNIILRKDFSGAETRLRYGAPADGAHETIAGQLIGGAWDEGHAMLGYQYWQRDPLAAADRKYTSSSDKRPLGGDNFGYPFTNPGNIVDPMTGLPAFAIPARQDGTSLTPGNLLPGVVNEGNWLQGADQISDQTMHSAFFSASQRIGNRLELHAEGRFSHRVSTQRTVAQAALAVVPSTHPYFVDPFGGSSYVMVYYSMYDDLGPTVSRGETQTYSGTIGGALTLTPSWQLDLDLSIGKELLRSTNQSLDLAALDAALADTNPATTFNPFGDGSHTNPATLDAIRMTHNERVNADVWSATALVQGPLFQLPSGEAKAAFGLDYREEGLDRVRSFAGSVTRRTIGPVHLRRNITAAFSELQVPLVRPDGERLGVQDLRLSLAGRFERYSDFGDTFNPKLGLSWTPIGAVQIRGSIGTAFRAPNLTDLDESSPFRVSRGSLLVVPDPKSASGQSRILVLEGNNTDLKEETATTWSMGVDFRPGGIPDLGASLTYFDIDFKDRIQAGGPGYLLDIFRAEGQWAPIITRDPSAAMLEAACSRAQATVQMQACLNSAAIVDARMRNLGQVEVRGVDAELRYTKQTDIGRWGARLDGTYLLEFNQAVTRTSPATDLMNTVNGPMRMRLRGGLSWEYRGITADTFVQYQNSYTDNLSQPNRKVDAFTTVDVRLAYSLPNSSEWMNGTELALAVSNVFDRDPPFINSLYGYDTLNANPLGRVVSLQLTKQWGQR